MPRKPHLFVGLSLVLTFLLLQAPIFAVSAPSKEPLFPSRPSQLNAIVLPNVQITIDQVVASGLILPVQATHAGDGSGRLFIVEQTGKIRILKNGVLLGTPFLDLTSLVSCCGERGLLGLAFHPSYESNGFFYVNYTRAGDGATVIARYSVSANPDVANAASASQLLLIAQPFSNHNGGQLAFSPLDGYLYIGMGDGGSGGDPQNNAQNVNSLLGKMLRIDVDHGTPYSNPADNPYVGKTGADDLGDRAAQPLAFQLRPADRRPVHRGCRSEPVGRDRLPGSQYSRRVEFRLALPGRQPQL